MPITTDSVLLGAWAFTGNDTAPETVLDIGTGCGVLALMMAQRFPHARIDAIEIDGPSAEEARENVQTSPWPDRISVIHADFKTFAFSRAYSLIVCNPPYFQQALESPHERRNRARHGSTSGLTYQQLVNGVSRILRNDGTLALILPAATKAAFLKGAMQNRLPLYPSRITYVVTSKKAAAPSLVLMELTKKETTPQVETLYLYDESGVDYHPQYRDLVRDFYLWQAIHPDASLTKGSERR
jgi:tRNA1Val (adenine37-N6)-methyltransferase